MAQKNFGIKVDICEQGCLGIWFDQHELCMLDEHDEGLGQALEKALKHPRLNSENREQLQCPKCNIPLQTHRYKRACQVNVDECYNCGGFFLDSGELKEVRDNYMNDEEVHAYAEQLLQEVPGYEEAMKDVERGKRRRESIDHLTRFFRVSYWQKKFT